MQIKNLANNKSLIILSITAIIAALYIWINQNRQQTLSSKPTKQIQQNHENQKPEIVSTKPDPLEEAIISTTETLEITLNRPLENVGEFKSKIEPKIDYKVELSSDRKTAKIIPIKPFELGTTYTLFIGTETKFDGVGRWGMEKIFHFKTITYRGV